MERISLKDIKNHPWFLKNLPRELTESAQALYYRKDNPSFSVQTVEEIMKIVAEARNPPSARSKGTFGWGGEDDDDDEDDEKEEEDVEEDYEDDEYDKTVKAVHASGEFHVS
ncbi:hypothetical protein Syun_002906 [Stephania yunnanensis]|uniref:Uncharacterized protein n=1 Tax=Stephania yunnanensis TaxID=152371 RepID=A0AAP0L273_9MAGN